MGRNEKSFGKPFLYEISISGISGTNTKFYALTHKDRIGEILDQMGADYTETFAEAEEITIRRIADEIHINRLTLERLAEDLQGRE